jgi:hypothetical protein
LVHNFGSTPILTRTYQEATYLAEFCFKKGPLPTGLWWVHECPDDMNDAIDFSLDRMVREARAAHLGRARDNHLECAIREQPVISGKVQR